MGEAILNSLSAFVRSDNFPGKRQFITKMNGIDMLSEMIHLSSFGNDAQLRKIKLKLVQLLYDLLLNDDSILNDGFVVRDAVGKNFPLVESLLRIITNSNLVQPQENNLRDYTLNSLYRIYQRNPNLKEQIEGFLNQHISKVNEAIATLPDRAEQLNDELKLTYKVL